MSAPAVRPIYSSALFLLVWAGLVTKALPLAVGVLFLAVSLKLIAVAQGVAWAVENARAYTLAYEQSPPATDREEIDLLRSHGRYFFPFGIKDWWLRELNLIRANDTPAKRALRTCSRRTSSWLFSAKRLAHLSILTCITAAMSLPSGQSALPWLATLVALMSTGMALETVVWWISAKASDDAFHQIGRQRRAVRSAREMAELKTFARLTSYAAVTTLVACTTLERQEGGFGGASGGGAATDELERLARFSYFVLTNLTTTGGSEVVPLSGHANLLAALLQLQTLLIVTFALGSFLSVFRGSGTGQREDA